MERHPAWHALQDAALSGSPTFHVKVPLTQQGLPQKCINKKNVVSVMTVTASIYALSIYCQHVICYRAPPALQQEQAAAAAASTSRCM